ncbi:MAG: hypothetical protein KatS3mg005_4161 [Bryobacteraceae bacterium]|nr:MAG: hypothetical protein KatS3mg005_4161 [Bryobacteraceae bacterium]
MPVTTEDLLRLPSYNPVRVLPDGSIDWRFYVPTGDFWPTPEGWKFIPGSITGQTPAALWLDQHKTELLIAGGALLLLLLLGRRR